MKKVIRFVTKAITNKYDWHRHHLRHKLLAKKQLRGIEQYKDKTNPQFIKLSNEYAKDVLGWKGCAPWLYVYSAIAEQFKEGWIPDNYYGSIVQHALKGKYGSVSDLKSLSYKFFKGTAFPDLAYYVNGLFISTNYDILQTGEIKNILFKDSETIVFKKDNSMRGWDVYFFNKNTFNVEQVYRLGNGVFQDYINQHQVFEEILPSSVATIRATTILDDKGNSSLRGCLLKVSRCTETHTKSESSIRIPIDIKTGEIESIGYLHNWHIVDTHPDTRVQFSNMVIPNFKNCITEILKLQKMIPQVRCIGWDFTIDKNNALKVMEWNSGYNGISFCEATQGPCFADLGWEKLWRQ